MLVLVAVVVVNWNINTDLYSCNVHGTKVGQYDKTFMCFEHVEVLPYTISGTSIKWQ